MAMSWEAGPVTWWVGGWVGWVEEEKGGLNELLDSMDGWVGWRGRRWFE